MNAKTTIRKILFVTIWVCIGTGMLTLLLATISRTNKGECKGYKISLKGMQNNFFIDEKGVEELLMKATRGSIKGQAISSFNLHGLEQMLEHNTWIDKAELYFDNRDVLHITVTEKEPVARIFTTTGNSFYIDSLGRRMPLSDKLSARVPVFTGFPEKKKLTAGDSVLLDEIKEAANFIINDAFWVSQVAQMDITTDRKFEMVPVVGNHLVKFGNGGDIDRKFHRLMVFYKQVLSKTGFDRYKIIDVQYKGQVVVSKYAGVAKIDSVQLKKNVEKLLRQSLEAENDTMIRAMPPLVKLEADSATTIDPSLQDTKDIGPGKNTDPNPVKSSLPKPTDNKPKPLKPKPADKNRQPKAVMPKKTVEEDNGGYN